MGNPLPHTRRAPTPQPGPFTPAPGKHTLGTYTRALWPRMFLGLLAAAGMRVVDIAIPQVLSFAVDDLLAQNTTEAMVWAGGTLVIAHRLSTVLASDRVLVIDDGTVVEEGSPAQLIAAGGTHRPIGRGTSCPRPPAHAIILKLSTGYPQTFGMWRSLVARVVRDDEVAGSNPVIPTIGTSPGSLQEPGLLCLRMTPRTLAPALRCANIVSPPIA